MLESTNCRLVSQPGLAETKTISAKAGAETWAMLGNKIQIINENSSYKKCVDKIFQFLSHQLALKFY